MPFKSLWHAGETQMKGNQQSPGKNTNLRVDVGVDSEGEEVEVAVVVDP